MQPMTDWTLNFMAVTHFIWRIPQTNTRNILTFTSEKLVSFIACLKRDNALDLLPACICVYDHTNKNYCLLFGTLEWMYWVDLPVNELCCGKNLHPDLPCREAWRSLRMVRDQNYRPSLEVKLSTPEITTALISSFWN